MANNDISMDVCEQVAKRPKLDIVSPSWTNVTNHFSQRDQEVHMVLNWLMQDANGKPYIRLPQEVENKIANMVHNEGHRERMSKVFNQMNDLPKCKTCGSVSTLVSLSNMSFFLF